MNFSSKMLGLVQTSNFSCAEPNVNDDLSSLFEALSSFAFGSGHEKFG